jgi:DNA-binding response OmpR family regulator
MHGRAGHGTRRAFGAVNVDSRNRRSTAARQTPPTASRQAVLLVGDDRDWPVDLRTGLEVGGYEARGVLDLSLVPTLVASGSIRALLVLARPLGASELLVLRSVREDAPHTAIVAVTQKLSDPDLKRAFESGATAYLSWPASADALRQAVESGTLPAPGARGRR